MIDLIDRNHLMDEIESITNWGNADVMYDVNAMIYAEEQIDAVQVIRCKDCKYAKEDKDDKDICYCEANRKYVIGAEDYCSDGEKVV